MIWRLIASIALINLIAFVEIVSLEIKKIVNPTIDCGNDKFCDALTLSLDDGGKSYSLKLVRNNYLLGDEYRSSLNGTSMSTNCHYQLEVAAEGWAALSICDNQIDGVFSIDDTYFIEIQSVKNSTTLQHFQVTMDMDGPSPLLANTTCDDEQSDKNLPSDKTLLSSPTSYAPNDSVLPDTYVQVVLINDHAMFKQYARDETKLIADVMMIMNIANMFMRDINVHLLVNGIITWKDGDKISRGANLKGHLEKFRVHAPSYKEGWKYEEILLHTAIHFGTTNTGNNDLGGLCSQHGSMGVVNFNNPEKIIRTRVENVMHEVGHSLGLFHVKDIKGPCRCPGNHYGRCVMGEYGHYSTRWSRCSIDALRDLLYNGGNECTLSKPGWGRPSDQRPICRNGVVEQGEDCDCSARDAKCTANCNLQTCKFKKA